MVASNGSSAGCSLTCTVMNAKNIGLGLVALNTPERTIVGKFKIVPRSELAKRKDEENDMADDIVFAPNKVKS